MKVSANGAMFGRSMMIARRPGPSGSRRSRHCRSRRPLLLLGVLQKEETCQSGGSSLAAGSALDDSMGLSDLDGFLTGVVVGPELIPPSEWLPVVWGGAEPEFETQEEMRTVFGTIMGRSNEIAACFNSDPDEFDPIFWEGPEGEVIASDWAGGFLDAVALRSQAWRPLIGDDRAGILLAPLFLLNGDIEFDDGAAVEDELLAGHRT